jgi:hypothetical protein
VSATIVSVTDSVGGLKSTLGKLGLGGGNHAAPSGGDAAAGEAAAADTAAPPPVSDEPPPMTDEERMRQIESSLMSPSMRGTRLSHLAIGGLPVGIALVALSRADIGDRLSFGGGADADDTDTESDDAEGGDEAPSSGVAATSSAAPRAMAGAWQWRVAVAFGSGSGVWQWRVAVAVACGSGIWQWQWQWRCDLGVRLRRGGGISPCALCWAVEWQSKTCAISWRGSAAGSTPRRYVTRWRLGRRVHGCSTSVRGSDLHRGTITARVGRYAEPWLSRSTRRTSGCRR